MLDLTITNSGSASVPPLDASASTGNLDLRNVDLSSSGAPVTLGEGDDMITSGLGGDTMTGGAGNDIFVYTDRHSQTLMVDLMLLQTLFLEKMLST